MTASVAGKSTKNAAKAPHSTAIKPGLSDEFQQLFDTQIQPKLADIEKFRLSMLAINRLLKWILMPAAIIGGIIAGFLLTPIASLIAIAIGFWLTGLPVKTYHQHYKSNIMGVLISAFGDFKYDSKGTIQKDRLQGFSIFPSHDNSKGEDYIAGVSYGITLEFCELTLTKSHENSSSTVFDGCAFLLTLPFEFEGHTVARKDRGKLLNFAAAIFNSAQRVTLENPDFEKLFEVRSDNPHDARYILSPGMMDRILALYALFASEAQGKSMCFEFQNNQALFLVEYKGDLLEAPSIRTTVYQMDQLPLIEKELAMVVGIIKQLNLDYLALRKSAVNRVHSEGYPESSA